MDRLRAVVVMVAVGAVLWAPDILAQDVAPEVQPPVDGEVLVDAPETAEGGEVDGEPGEASALGSGGVSREAAQADVSKARKLIKIQRYDEAVKLLQDAYLVLEDPELIRILGEVHQDKGDNAAALRFFDDYLADPGVGESSKDSVRKRRDALPKVATGDGGRSGGGAEEEDDLFDWKWESGGAAIGLEGQFYLTFGLQILHDSGDNFTTTRGGDGPGADAAVTEDWTHGGGGAKVEGGFYLYDGMSLGLSLGMDLVNWENRAFQQEFETVLTDGLRPNFSLNLRYHFGWGFHVGAAVGGDAIVITEVPDQSCDSLPESACPDFTIGDGAQGVRLILGAMLGYRAVLTESMSLGMDFGLARSPLFFAFEGATVDKLPAFTDSSLLFTAAVVMNWNL